MNKSELLDLMSSERAAWDALLAQIPPEQRTQPGIVAHWSTKDLIAHVTWYEREMIEVMETHRLEGSPWWNLSTDERNAAIYEHNKDRSLADVEAESPQVFQRLLTAVAALAEADLHDASRFADMPPEWKPLDMLASNTYEHYPQHIDDVRAWIDKHKT